MPTPRVTSTDLVTRDNQRAGVIYAPTYGPMAGRIFATPDGVGRHFYDTLEDALADRIDLDDPDAPEIVSYEHDEEERVDYEQRYWRAAADFNDYEERVEIDDDDPCPCGKAHTRAEHTYDPDND